MGTPTILPTSTVLAVPCANITSKIYKRKQKSKKECLCNDSGVIISNHNMHEVKDLSIDDGRTNRK